jgi:hypothetical protein
MDVAHAANYEPNPNSRQATETSTKQRLEY